MPWSLTLAAAVAISACERDDVGDAKTAIAVFASEAEGGVESPAVQLASEIDIIASEQEDFRIHIVAQGLEWPWSLDFLPDGGMLVTEQAGRVRYIAESGAVSAPLSGVPTDIYYERQNGFHSVVVGPDFDADRAVYLTYTAGDEEANYPVLVKFRLVENALVDREILFKPEAPRIGASHSGNRLLISSDRKIYLSVGHVLDYLDDTRQAQDLTNVYGSIIRLNLDGTAPVDNPYVDDPVRRPEIYSYGHRNAQGLAQREDGTIWAVEHGPKGGDEFNKTEKGANYGWPLATYGEDYTGDIIYEHRRLEGAMQPVWYWSPSIAPSSIIFYDGDQFPEWKGDAFVTAMAGMQVQRLELDGDKVIGVEPMLTDIGERFRDIKQGPDGMLYLLTDSEDSRILRIGPATYKE